ncbi:MAG: phosphonate metabolism transcriptional regulator PhnF [Robiginitomaculum sp.]|nr:MAG: phosphonate metabolism transcriptional regulator PhnF [Robiginitomaculum sp.]
MTTNSLLLWQLIVKDIEAKISSGELLPGARLSTENKLAEHFDVNRHTVRRAIRELVMQNLVEVTQGRGSFVCRPRVSIDYSKDIYAPSDVQIVLAKSGHGHGKPIRTEPATAQMARALQIEQSDPVAVLDFEIKSIDGEALALTTRTLPLERLPGVLEAFDEVGNLPTALERLNVRRITRKWVRTRARTASAEERTALSIDLHTPLLIVGCLFVNADARPVLHDCSLFAADRVEVYSHNVPG